MLSFLEQISRELYIIFVSMLPVIELRGAIPMGIAMGFDTVTVFILSVLGNCLPVPLVLWLTRPAMAYLRKTKLFSPFAAWLERRTEKNREQIMKYSALGLLIFVAIPLPGTGAWSGAIAASILDMRFKYALPSIMLGVAGAGIIMCFGTKIVQYLIHVF